MPADPGHLYRARRDRAQANLDRRSLLGRSITDNRHRCLAGTAKASLFPTTNSAGFQLNPSPQLPNPIPKSLQIPPRRVWREETLYLLNYEEIAYHEATFAQTVENLRMLFDGIVKYNRDHGLLTFVMNSRCRSKII